MAKIQVNLFCPICKKVCTDTDEWSLTKRATKQYFHRKCYEVEKNERSKNTARSN